MPAILLPRRYARQPHGAVGLAEGWEWGWLPYWCSGGITPPASYHSERHSPEGVEIASAASAGVGLLIAPAMDPLWDFGTGPFVVAAVIRMGDITANTTESTLLGSGSATNHWRLYVRSSGSAWTVRAAQGLTSSTDYTLAPGDTAVIVTGRRRDGSTYLLRRNLTSGLIAERTGTDTTSWYLRRSDYALRLIGQGSEGFPGGVLAAGMRRGDYADPLGLLLEPWQMFRGARRALALPAAGGQAAEIGGAVAGAGSVAADIHTQIDAAAVTLGVGAVGASLATAIPLAAQVQGVGDVAGGLAVQIRVSAEVLGAALVQAGLATRIDAGAVVLGEGAAQAALSVGVSLGGDVLGDALVQAGLATRIDAAAAVQGDGAVQASLGGAAAQLGAVVLGGGQVLAGITTRIDLGAQVLGAALVSGALQVSVPVAAAIAGAGQIQASLGSAITASAEVAGVGVVEARIEIAVLRVSAPRIAHNNLQSGHRPANLQTGGRRNVQIGRRPGAR
ncbi:hypothetical protein GPA19_08025 [Azoarcus indigens]|uniref:Uncharacterized protein n=1 Tax=Azoarcus indigens TaxID=29545 RepID=A0A4R6E0C6_9RHOO|nr:hypothetical protein [Azoarcus indigens]NMG64891.1 hypothetical protein [Azoarcus indigens]TDN50429.1 hypothetical protein C7389_109123 [Azoarcus indigens]